MKFYLVFNQNHGLKLSFNNLICLYHGTYHLHLRPRSSRLRTNLQIF